MDPVITYPHRIGMEQCVFSLAQEVADGGTGATSYTLYVGGDGGVYGQPDPTFPPFLQGMITFLKDGGLFVIQHTDRSYIALSSGGVLINGVQVVGPQQPKINAASTNSLTTLADAISAIGDLRTKLNAALTLLTNHGLMSATGH